MVGRLMAYKRFDIVIRAFNELGWPLVIIGRGPDLKRLEKMANPNIRFAGRLSDEALAKTYARAKAFIFPQEEDFGIVAIEAMASGKPIIAFRGGDIVEHVQEGKEGLFFDKQHPKDIIKVLRKFDPANFSSKDIRARSIGFDREIFKSRMKDYIETALKRHKSR